MAPLMMVACFFFLVRFLSYFKVCLNFQVVRGVQFEVLSGNIVSLVSCWSVVEESFIFCFF